MSKIDPDKNPIRKILEDSVQPVFAESDHDVFQAIASYHDVPYLGKDEVWDGVVKTADAPWQERITPKYPKNDTRMTGGEGSFSFVGFPEWEGGRDVLLSSGKKVRLGIDGYRLNSRITSIDGISPEDADSLGPEQMAAAKIFATRSLKERNSYPVSLGGFEKPINDFFAQNPDMNEMLGRALEQVGATPSRGINPHEEEFAGKNVPKSEMDPEGLDALERAIELNPELVKAEEEGDIADLMGATTEMPSEEELAAAGIYPEGDETEDIRDKDLVIASRVADISTQPVINPVPLAESPGHPEESIDEALEDAPSAIGYGPDKTSAAHKVEEKDDKYYVVEDGEGEVAGPFDEQGDAYARANELNDLENLENDETHKDDKSDESGVSITITMARALALKEAAAHKKAYKDKKDTPSPKAAEEVFKALDEGDHDAAHELMGHTDCPMGCETQNEGVCKHGYMSAGRTRVIFLDKDLRRSSVKVADIVTSEKKCDCWDGYERVPGTKPCAPGSCRKCDDHRESSVRNSGIRQADFWDDALGVAKEVAPFVAPGPYAGYELGKGLAEGAQGIGGWIGDQIYGQEDPYEIPRSAPGYDSETLDSMRQNMNDNQMQNLDRAQEYQKQLQTQEQTQAEQEAIQRGQDYQRQINSPQNLFPRDQQSQWNK